MDGLSENAGLEREIMDNHPDETNAGSEQNTLPAPTQGGFLFITSSGKKTKQDRQQLRTLRGHVMLNYLERKDAEKQVVDPSKASRLSFKSAESREPAMAGGQKLKFRMRAGELEVRHPYRYRKGKRSTRRKAATDEEDVSQDATGLAASIANEKQVAKDSGFVPGMPVTWLGSRNIDVFGVLPVHLDEGDEASIHLFQSYERYPWCPINGQSSWSSFALSDQLVFHATMFSWGMHFRHRRPTPDPQEEMKTLQHKVAAISLINDRLSDSTQAANDETVAAVAALTNIALVIDSYPEASKHMAGLWAIVQMRGGLSSLRSSVQQHLQRLISWNDLIYSEVFDEKLRFPPIEVWDESWGTLQRQGRSVPLLGLSRAELKAAGVPRHEVLDILDDIRDLCEAEQLSPLKFTDDKGRMRRGDMFHRIERKMRIIAQGDTAPGNSRWDATVWRAVSLAALIFTHHHLRGNPLKYRHFNVLSMQLYDTLLTMDEDLSDLDFAPSLLVWILSTGAVVTTLNVAVRSSFVFMLGKACVKYGLTDYDSFQRTLSQFLWTGDADEARYSELWRELQASMRSL
ncbi:hypothetical protein H2200_009847 [Cladophialophora chaetospira]|uniref:Uncharacterized protein n=1 Tax=Cladophialophora chaetospira TaxID=386627 RepID=A0AA38X3F7_9EURO|nr:hypothetical protein H2200_009847 [Cladophialophora chaetospira]